MTGLTPACSCCGGYKRVVMIGPQLHPKVRRLRPQAGDSVKGVLSCVDCDRMNLWPNAYRLREAR